MIAALQSGSIVLDFLFHPLSLADVANHRLEYPAAVEFQGIEQDVGGKHLAAIEPLVCPFETEGSLLQGRGDLLIGQRQGVCATWLFGGRQVGRMAAAEVGLVASAEDLQGCLIAVEKAVLVQEHHGVAGRIVQRAELGFGAMQGHLRPLTLGKVQKGFQKHVFAIKVQAHDALEDGNCRAVPAHEDAFRVIDALVAIEDGAKTLFRGANRLVAKSPRKLGSRVVARQCQRHVVDLPNAFVHADDEKSQRQ